MKCDMEHVEKFSQFQKVWRSVALKARVKYSKPVEFGCH